MLLALSGILPDIWSVMNVAGWQHASQSEQNARAPIRTLPTLDRSVPAPFLSQELRASDTDSDLHYCLSPRAGWGEQLHQVLCRALPRHFLMQLQFLRRRISQVNSRRHEQPRAALCYQE